MTRTNIGLDPSILLDVAEIGAEYILDGLEKGAEWGNKLAEDVGDWVKPHLDQIWEASLKLYKGIDAPPAVKKAIKRIPQAAPPEEVISGTRDKISAKIAKGKDGELTPLFRKLAEAFYAQGIRTLEPMIDALHSAVQDLLPDMSRDEVYTVLSGRGKYTLPNQNAIKKGVRQLSAEARIVGHILQLLAAEAKEDPEGLTLPHTGMQRDKPTAEFRRQTQRLNEINKRLEPLRQKLGITTSDPQSMLATALQAAKTYTRNRIADLKQEIATRERIVKTKTPLQPDAELEAMRAELKQVQADHDAVFGKREVSLEARAAALERTIAEMERKLREGDIGPKPKPVDRPADPLLEPLKQRRDALSKQLAQARKKPELQRYAERQQRILDSLNKQIAAREAKLASGKLEPEARPQQANRPMAPELEQARQQLDALNRQIAEGRKAQARAARNTPEAIVAAAGRLLDRQIAKLEADLDAGRLRTSKTAKAQPETPELVEKRAWLSALREHRQALKDAQNPKLTPEQRLARTISSRIAHQMADYMTRLANGDFETRVKRPPVKLDATAEMNRAALLRLKEQWRVGNEKLRLKGRKDWQKAAEWVVKWERAYKLSSPVVFGKLSAAAITRVLTTATEEIVGVPLSLAMPRLAERAAREGGFNARAMAKGLTAAFTQGMKDARQTLTQGGADIDVVYGGKILDKEWASLLGQLHGMMKAPVKRFEFTLSLEKRLQRAALDGEDITDRTVQMRHAALALDDGYRAIFMQRGFSSDLFNNAVSTAEKMKNFQPTGEIAARIARFLLPIVRVPTNIVAETASGAFHGATGLLVPSVRYMVHAINGTLADLDPRTADSIMRQFKKGSVGLGLMAIGYMNADNIGGYNWHQKRRPGEAKVGGFRIGGHDVPRWATHAPWFELMQIGATIRRVKEEVVRKTGEEKGISEGLWSAGFGLVEETPFVGEMLRFDKLQTPSGRDAYVGELLKSTLVPGAIEKIAQWTDLGVEKRKPGSIIEHVESAIPGLRQRVPEAP